MLNHYGVILVYFMQTKFINSLVSMSLKRYLFLLIALFVLGLASTQLFFINYIQQQIGAEVEGKSQTLSKQALKLLVNSLPHSQQQVVVRENNLAATPDNQSIVVRIENTPNKSVELGNGNRFISGDQTQTVTVGEMGIGSNIVVREALEGRLQEMSFKPIGGSNAFIVKEQQVQHIVQFDKENSAISQYFRWLAIGTIILTALGLMLAYLLAKHISRPLGELSNGFNRLQQGDLGSQVKPSGILEVRETLQSFNQMSTRLEQLNQVEIRFHQQQQLVELGEVARGLAHTLRNPINTIGLAIEQIGQTDLSQQQRCELAQQARQKIMHLDNTIKALLTLTTNDLQRDQQVSINQVINDILLELSMTGKHKIEFAPMQDLQIYGAQVEIRAMIHTLLVNAIEASTEQQSISVFVAQEVEQLSIKIVDQGKGLSEKIKTELFKPHVSSKPEGAGMGLYIAKRISQSYYQGDVQLSNNSPHGCIATLTLSNCNKEVKPNE
jgi:signal transduction histidine kinase